MKQKEMCKNNSKKEETGGLLIKRKNERSIVGNISARQWIRTGSSTLMVA